MVRAGGWSKRTNQRIEAATGRHPEGGLANRRPFISDCVVTRSLCNSCIRLELAAGQHSSAAAMVMHDSRLSRLLPLLVLPPSSKRLDHRASSAISTI